MRALRVVLVSGLGVVALLAFAVTSVLAATPETVISAPTEVTATTAVFHGELNPNGKFGESYEWFFATAPSTNSCTEEIFAPEPFGTALGEEKELVETKVTGLQPNQSYTVCLATLKPGEFVHGPAVPFKTLPAAPVVVAGGTKAAAIGPFSATLEALVNPNNEETKYFFEYSEKEQVGALAGTIVTVPSTPGTIPAGFKVEGEPVSIPTQALAPDTTYYFRVVAENAKSKEEGEPVEGPIEHFTTGTPEPPVFESQEVTAINSSEPKFEAKINPNYQASEYHFEYASKANLATETLEGPVTIVAGAPPLADLPGVFSEAGLLAGPVGVSGLQPGPTYYRVVATNASGTTDGPVYEFRALGVPVVLTGAAGAPTAAAAAVSGSIVPQGVPTRYHFAYVALAQYEAGAANPFARGRETYETKLTGENEQSLNDYTAHPVALRLEELAPGTTYVYALVAHNELGSVAGQPQTFTTAPAPPSPPTGPVAVEAAVAPVGPVFAPAAVFPLLPYSSIAALDAGEAREGKASTPKSLTRAQKLANALKRCRPDKQKSRRTTCERQAHGRYGKSTKQKGKS